MVRNLEQVSRYALFAQVPEVKVSNTVTGVTPANGAVIEIPYVGRSSGAVQIYSPTGAAFVATFRIQGTLADVGANADGFVTGSTDRDYFTIGADITAPGIVQLPYGNTYGRIRVICTAWTSGNPVVKVL